MTGQPRISVIIPHYNGEAILLRCLDSLAKNAPQDSETLIIDNASSDESIFRAKQAFPEVRVISLAKNIGFAGGCNVGMRHALGRYFLLLNNDAVITKNCIEILADFADAHPDYAALQPKICSIDNDGYYDYAGAAGGMMDRYGFPFTRGRMFFDIEKDDGQYNDSREIFWASGTCTLLRKTAILKAGLLDEDFFAHMEEIDLNWRLHLFGFKVGVVPEAVAKHNAGSTLKQESPRKAYLNHRNSLIMMLKNYELNSLIKLFPLRSGFEVIAFFYELSKLNLPRATAIVKAYFAALWHLLSKPRKRKAIQLLRTKTDAELTPRFYQRSIVVDYFIRRKKKFSELEND